MSVDLKNIFEQIRDTPYRISTSAEDEDLSCVGKNKKLLRELITHNFGVRWRVCTFKWSDLHIPESLLKITQDDATHAYLEVKIKNTWQVVDTTWDAPLKNILPITEWDGSSTSKIGVPCLTVYTPEESAEIMDGITSEEIEKDLKINKNFYIAFNNWLEANRKIYRQT